MPRLEKKLFEDEVVEDKPPSKRKQQPTTPKNKTTKKMTLATQRISLLRIFITVRMIYLTTHRQDA